MNIALNKVGVISLFIVLIILLGVMYIPYVEFIPPRPDKNNQIIENFFNPKNYFVLITLFVLFYPWLMILEATFFSPKKSNSLRIIFLFQAVFIAFEWKMIGFMMTWNNVGWFSSARAEKAAGYYIVLSYLAIGFIWNILLIIPYFDKNKYVTGVFQNLSLIKKTKS